MKSKTFRLITALFAALAIPASLIAQDHPRYKLIDLGTLGGLHSYGSVNGDGFQLLNNSGVVASFADTAVPDPNAPNFCFDPDCLLAHAFRWKEGVVTDLGALPGNNSSAAGSINARGWITGQSQTGSFDPILNGPGVHAVLWKHGDVTDLGSLGGGASLGIYVNNAGQVVGISDTTVPDPFSLFGIGVQLRTFLWENGAIRDIGTLGGPDALPGASCSGQPHDVVVGASYTSFTPNAATGIPTIDPFLWKSGKMIDLGNLGGTLSLGAQCANRRGQIIGQSNLAGDAMSHAFFWEDGVMTDLGTLGGNNSEAIWINKAGNVVGSADLPGSQIHDAVIWRHGKIRDLGTVTGDACSRGRGLNSRGQVVGGSSDCRNFLHAFVWEEGGAMLDLNTLIAPGSGYQLTNAFNINDRGQILAKADPIGVTPIDDQDLGHLMLLIPCEGDDDEGCDANETAANNAGLHTLVPVIRSTAPTAAQRPLTPSENVAAWRARLAQRFHIAGLGIPTH